jgi:hypothetical protein
MPNPNVRRMASTLVGALVFAGLIFGGAGTFDYWQGWLYFAVFAVCSIATGLYLAVHDPALLERRMKVGPTAEQETPQKIIITLALRIASLNIVPGVLSALFSSSVAMPCICSFRHGGPTAARADAVKVGRRADLEAGAAGDRPHLDGVEHDAMLEPSQDGTCGRYG